MTYLELFPVLSDRLLELGRVPRPVENSLSALQLAVGLACERDEADRALGELVWRVCPHGDWMLLCCLPRAPLEVVVQVAAAWARAATSHARTASLAPQLLQGPVQALPPMFPAALGGMAWDDERGTLFQALELLERFVTGEPRNVPIGPTYYLLNSQTQWWSAYTVPGLPQEQTAAYALRAMQSTLAALRLVPGSVHSVSTKINQGSYSAEYAVRDCAGHARGLLLDAHMADIVRRYIPAPRFEATS